MQVCHIVPSLEERHGGPSKSVRAVVSALVDSAVTADLLTTHAAGEAAPVGTDRASVHSFPRAWPAFAYRSPELRAHLGRTRYDCIHHHAIWNFTLGYAHDAAQRQRVPLVISPRGMMSPWAWSHHRLRKQLAARVIHPGALAGASGWHATSAQEAEDIRRLGFRQPVCVAPNGVELPSADALATASSFWRARCPVVQSRPVALFYSRFHRKKRVRELVELWQTAPRGDWLLLLCGIPEEYSVDEIRSWVEPPHWENILVFSGEDAPPPFAIASLFLLPSHSENFGLVVAEALAAGVPVLTTDATPWQELESRQAGWCRSWERFPASLASALAEPAQTLCQRGSRGRDWVAKAFTWQAGATKLREFYASLVRA